MNLFIFYRCKFPCLIGVIQTALLDMVILIQVRLDHKCLEMHLPLSVLPEFISCNFQSEFFLHPRDELNPYLRQYYSVSYLWIAFFSALVTLAGGIIISLLTGKETHI